jgi:hypothetical protein
VLASLAACTSGGGTSSAAGGPPAATAGGATAQPAPSATLGADATLVRVKSGPAPGIRRGQQAEGTDLVAGPAGFVALGYQRATSTGAGYARHMWWSQDGGSWQDVPLDRAVFGPQDTLKSLLAAGPGYVIAGTAGGRAVSWSSADGRHWQRHPLPSGSLPRDTTTGATGLFDVGGGLLVVPAVQEVQPAGAVTPTSSSLRMWTSADGVSWKAATVAALPAKVTGSPVVVNHVVRFHGQLVALAVTLRQQPQDTTSQLLLTSDDGAAWTVQRAAFPDSETIDVDTLAVYGDHLLAFGKLQQGRYPLQPPAEWTSTDGLTWQKVLLDTSAFGGTGTAYNVFDVVPVRGQLLAWGWRLTPLPKKNKAWPDLYDEDVALWRSSDGTHWQRLPSGPDLTGPGQQRVDAVAVAGDRVLALGTVSAPYPPPQRKTTGYGQAYYDSATPDGGIALWELGR